MGRLDAAPIAGLRAGTVPMLALACGVMVANIYLCQPLLAEIARSFGVQSSQAATVAVLTQIGYTLGILLVVPLADVLHPARLIPVLQGLAVLALLGAGLAPDLPVLLVASLCVAASSVIAQILIPYVTTLCAAEYRGRIVSALSGGLILGILLSRVFSGLLAAGAGSWRAPFLFQAVLVLLLACLLPRYLGAGRVQAPGVGYLRLLRSLPPLLQHRELRLSILLSVCSFAAFSAIWATLAFHLASPHFALGPAAVGLFGLWGAPGALLAPRIGRLVDRCGPDAANGLSLLALAICVLLAWGYGGQSLAALVLAVNLLDFGQQSGQVANQARIFGLDATIRARLNTLYMVATFAGGAAGASAGALAWAWAGWSGVCLFAAVMIGLGMLALALSRRVGRA